MSLYGEKEYSEMEAIMQDVLVWDQDHTRREWKKVPTGRFKFTEEDRMAIVAEYVSGHMPASQIIEKYHLSSRQILFNWMDKYVNEKELVSLQDETNPSDPMAKKSPEDRVKELEAENKKLQKAMELEKLRSKAYDTMIDVAEETFNIPIRKKIWHQTVALLRESTPEASLGALCGLFGYSRQSFYKHKENDFAEDAIEPLIVEKAKDYRKDNPGLGCVKLYIIISTLFKETGCMPGRDAFIEILRKNGLMVHIRRRRRYKTTDSNHHYRKYPNLIKDVVPHRPNEIWVSDITYIETDEGVCYLSLITDAYSHKIVGWALGSTLETIYPLEALGMALDTIDDETASRLIHHSDRGCQYCSDAYVSELKKHGVSISMTQSGDPLENSIAERANGILKSEWLYKMTIPTREVCKLELCRIIDFYNTQRPHMSIGWQTPEQAHDQCGEQQRCRKNHCRHAVASEDPQLGVYAPGLSRLTEETLTEEVAV